MHNGHLTLLPTGLCFPVLLQYSTRSLLLPALIAFNARDLFLMIDISCSCCVFRGWFLSINSENPHHAFSGAWLLIITQAVCKPVWPLWNCEAMETAASKEQHLVSSTAEVEQKPSCSTMLLPATAGKCQHEESKSLWRSFLPSLGLVFALASWSAKTREKVNL